MKKPSGVRMSKLFGLFLFLSLGKSLFAIEGSAMISTDKAFHDRWYKTVSAYPQEIPATTVVYRQQFFYVVPFVGLMSVDGKGTANVTYDIYIKRNGKTILSKKNLKGLQKKADPEGRFMCETVTGFELPDTAAVGMYMVMVSFTDHIANTKKTLEIPLELRAFLYTEKPFTNTDSFNYWKTNYYNTGMKDRELDGLWFFAAASSAGNDKDFFPLMGFFVEVFKDNHYLLAEVEKTYKSRNENERLVVLYLFQFLDYWPPTLAKKLNEDEKNLLEDLKTVQFPIIPKDTLNNPLLLDILWNKFFATGKYLYMKKITEALELAGYKGSIEKFNTSGKTETDKKAAFYETIYQTTAYSIMLYKGLHPLVRDYCQYILRYEPINPLLKEELEKVSK